MQIIVVGCKHREPVITAYLPEYRLSVTPDYDLPVDFKPLKKYVCWTNYLRDKRLDDHSYLGHYRCYRGHVDALLTVTEPTLVFEDDCLPKDGWMKTVEAALPHLSRWPIISLHGRGVNYLNFRKQVEIMPSVSVYAAQNHKWWRETVQYVAGSTLAYLVTPEMAQKLCRLEYRGLPIDLTIASRKEFGLVGNSPFIHDPDKDKSILEKI